MVLFAVVVQHQSISGAARELGLAKSGVSKRIRVLEEHLGVRLLNRNTRGLRLTDAGVRYYEHCASVLASAEAAQHSIQGTEAGDRGLIRISAAARFAHLHLIPIIAGFTREHPGVSFDLRVEDATIKVAESRFDLVIRIAPSLTEGSVVARRLGSDRLVVIGSPDYLARTGTPNMAADLTAHTCLRYEPRHERVEWRFDTEAGPVSIPITSTLSASDDDALRAAALHGMGLAIMPRSFVLRDLEDGSLVSVLDDVLHQPARNIYAVMPERRLLPTRIKSFLAFAADHVSRTR